MANGRVDRSRVAGGAINRRPFRLADDPKLTVADLGTLVLDTELMLPTCRAEAVATVMEAIFFKENMQQTLHNRAEFGRPDYGR
ncbi:hypothetical protein Mapa_010405 [Marchantia paleacea]|nr:hypothetical protein Mapa_010405 [Marchantia paleacea]